MSSNPASLRSPRATWLVRSVLAVVGLLLAAGVAVDTRPNVAANGMVASPEPLATDVGLAILKAGGNAFDAAAAVQFALAVTYPNAGNIGGGGFMVGLLADGDTFALDFREEAPSAASAAAHARLSSKASTASAVMKRISIGKIALSRTLDLFGMQPMVK